MGIFRIQPHGRIQEWVAEEKGYFADEGLEYEFIRGQQRSAQPSVTSSDQAPAEVKRGAFEGLEAGRDCEISSACHWAINMAAHGEHGRMWGHAYSVTPAGLWVPPESDITKPEDLAGVEVAVGYHSGSHFSAIQAMEPFLSKDEMKLQFVGGPGDRCQLALDRRVKVANVFGTLSYVLEQQGFRKIVDSSFMIGFLINGDASDEQLWAYFNALQRAQREIDVAKEQYQHYLLDQMPAKYHDLYNPRASGIGERLVFEPYTKDTFDRTHKWMLDWEIFGEDQVGHSSYEEVVAGTR